MILDINFRLPSYVLKLNLPNYYMIERSKIPQCRTGEAGECSYGKQRTASDKRV